MRRMYIKTQESEETYYDFECNAFYFQGKQKDSLSPFPEAVLEILARDAVTISAEKLLENTERWGYADSNIKGAISAIRDLFERFGFGRLDIVRNVRGRGYICNRELVEWRDDTHPKTSSQNAAPQSDQESGAKQALNQSDDIISKVQRIVNQHPDVKSYDFIHDLHGILVAIEQNQSDRELLEQQLESCIGSANQNAIQSNGNKKAFYFTIYYILSLYCKRKEKVKHASLSLDKLIVTYGSFFEEFPLSIEVLSWRAKRLGRWDEALKYDKALIKILDIEVNAGVYTSFASSVTKVLELDFNKKKNGQNDSLWDSYDQCLADCEDADKYMPKIIEQWKKTWGEKDGYGKHYFVYGKLKLFSPEMSRLSPEKRKKQIEEARELFEQAYECEQDAPDSGDRKKEYKEYLKKCDECLEYWNARNGKSAYLLTTERISEPGKRTDVKKPNEDAFIRDDEHNIYLIADGVTRPHDEYLSSSKSLAAECAKTVCERIRDELLKDTSDDTAQSFRTAMIQANQSLNDARFKQDSAFYPCSTFIGAVIRGTTLYFYNCGDTMGILIRDHVKITFSERHNTQAEKLQLSKSEVYQNVHNNIERPEGFAIFNGNSAIENFLHIGHLALLPHDRIILVSDGLADYLYYTRAEKLAAVTKDEIIEQSQRYDQPPFHEYADDKTCIIIDVLG